QWGTQWGQTREALEAYTASRGGAALTSAAAAAQSVVAGAAPLSQSRVTQLRAQMGGLAQGPGSGALQAAQSLHSRLAVINAEVADVSGWRLGLRNGSSVQVLELSNTLLALIKQYIVAGDGDATSSAMAPTASTNGRRRSVLQLTDGNGQLQPSLTVSLLVQALLNASAPLSTFSSAAATLSTAALSTRSTAAAGPSSSAATATLDSLLLPSLNALSTPLASLAAALAAYESAAASPSITATTTLSQAASDLQAAVSATLGPVGAAVSAFSTVIPDSAALASTASNLQPLVVTLGSAASATLSLAALGTGGGGGAGQLYGTLSSINSSYLPYYTSGLRSYQLLSAALPSGGVCATSLREAAEGVIAQVSQLSDLVLDSAAQAGDELKQASDTIQSELLARVDSFTERYQGPSIHWAHVAYAVWMGCWGLLVALLVLLAVAV
ncbi:hypothetical protein Agub_g2653, partial [Astrephomene gubernaculifera]